MPFGALLMAITPVRDRRNHAESRAPDDERRAPTPREGKDDNGNGWPMNGNLPMWLQMIKAVGVTGVIAFFLVYGLNNELPRIKDLIAVLIKNQAVQEQALQDIKKKSDENTQMLRRICSIIAKQQGGSDGECWR